MTDNGRYVPIDPSVAANRGSLPVFPKRFYATVNVAPLEAGFRILLDGRGARTPARNPLAVPSEGLAEAMAEEWARVEREIDPRKMPFTRLVNSVIDGVSANRTEVRAEILRYAESDLIVYRAEDPTDLVGAQNRAWDPIVTWSRDALSAPLVLAQGVVFTEQAPVTLDRLSDVLDDLVGHGRGGAFRLGALHVITTLTGSALLALAVAAQRLTAREAWAAAHVDEDYQIARWGQDEEAAERRAARWVDMDTAATLLRLMPKPESHVAQ